MVRVGAAAPAELKETQHRVEDALSATRAAMAEGIVAGGGVALVHAEQALDGLEVSGDYAAGVDIVRRALVEPAYWIATNAGYVGEDVVERIRAMDRDGGFDALEGRYGDLVELGIIDPLRWPARRCRTAPRWAVWCSPRTRLVAEEQTPWNPALVSQYKPLDEGIPQPSPDASTPQSLGLGPSVG